MRKEKNTGYTGEVVGYFGRYEQELKYIKDPETGEEKAEFVDVWKEDLPRTKHYEYTLVDGIKSGADKLYWRNGRLRYVINYEVKETDSYSIPVRHGDFKYYNEDGTLRYHYQYNHGKLIRIIKPKPKAKFV